MRLGDLRIQVTGTRFGFRSDEFVEASRARLAEAAINGWTQSRAITACNLAQALSIRGEYAEAAALAGDAADLFRGLESQADLGWALSYRAAALAEIGRTSDAVDVAIEAAAIADSLQLPSNVVDSLRSTMPVALATGQPLLAARLWGTVRGMGDRGEFDSTNIDERIGEEWLARAATAASAIAVELAIREGASGDPRELLRALPHLLNESRAGASKRTLRHGELTKREVEILAFVAAGKSDAEISAILYISPKTVSVHVSNAKAKIGVDTRLEAALWSRERGLVDDVKSRD
jgi:DNA-binding CsgD family transcriptional regulator